MPRNGGLSRLTRLCVCVAFMVALLLNATAGSATIFKSCVKYQCCQFCTYYDQFGNELYEIDWCWSDSTGCAL
jgi:hypothetical protein